jgi:hypothetical protein
VELFLESFLGYAVQPGSHKSDIGKVEPEYPHFTGFVFKVRTLVFSLENSLKIKYVLKREFCPGGFRIPWNMIAS